MNVYRKFSLTLKFENSSESGKAISMDAIAATLFAFVKK